MELGDRSGTGTQGVRERGRKDNLRLEQPKGRNAIACSRKTVRAAWLRRPTWISQGQRKARAFPAEGTQREGEYIQCG
jgi:hypothetical protein